jgi:hypothetical protein
MTIWSRLLQTGVHTMLDCSVMGNWESTCHGFNETA